ncbi:MAG: (2Fe-2S)-binding protein [Chloroflexi bacterium]|nr:(2Fe-2S)-binding protein [Chloroflexota bacterium]
MTTKAIEKVRVSFVVNGRPVTVETAPHRTLLEVLRDDLDLTGTKEGCGTGDCGACTVHLDGEAVCSCLVLAPEVDGREVVTIEGVAEDGRLHPLQEAFIELGGLQCGFCTPGFIMTALAFLNKNPDPTEAEVREGIAGNLCRCTGYDKIVKAILAASDRMEAER